VELLFQKAIYIFKEFFKPTQRVFNIHQIFAKLYSLIGEVFSWPIMIEIMRFGNASARCLLIL